MQLNSLEAHVEVDFWSKAQVGDPDECWEWRGRVHKGRAVYPGGISQVAARTAYALYYEKHPGRLCVLHSCDNGMCVNPGHLSLGTQTENMRQKTERGRTPRGAQKGMSDLTDAKVADILARCARGEPQKVLALEYGVSKEAVNEIVLRKTWRHIPWEGESPARQAKELKAADTARAAERRRAGERVKEIAADMGVNYNTLWARLKERERG